MSVLTFHLSLFPVHRWDKLKFGFKPVIIVTHVTTYQRSSPGTQQVLSVSKQIYANHYFDSSLSITAVTRIPTSAGDSVSYLIYTNDSRSDSLAGSFSRVRRGLVESESVASLNALLLQTKANVEVSSANQSGSNPAVRKNPISEWLLRGARLYAWLLELLVPGFLILLIRHHSRRMQVRPPTGDPTYSKRLRIR